MRVFKSIENFEIKNPVVTIGMFDGVHKGHKEIIDTLKKSAKQLNGETVLLSFWPHPRMIFEGNKSVRLLSTMDEKVALLENAGIDNFVIIPFSREFANISYKHFVKEILVKQIKTNSVIIGYNHHFGKNREGNFEKLIYLGKKYGFNVEKLEEQMVENERVSSSVVRDALNQGKIETANKYLGYKYSFTGFVVKGNQNGIKLGYPTANIYMREPYKLIPGTGVYAVYATIDNKTYPGMMNIGFRPTIIEDNKQKSIEVHLFDFNDNLYGKEITVKLEQKTRDEQKFDSINQLKSQLKIDENMIRQIFSTNSKLNY